MRKRKYITFFLLMSRILQDMSEEDRRYSDRINQLGMMCKLMINRGSIIHWRKLS